MPYCPLPLNIKPRLSSAVTFALAASVGASAQTPATAPTNVILILPDQWRAQAFGFAGDPNVSTPHLNQLARESVSCVNAIASVPVCCPTRASLMTGQRPLTHGVFLNDVPLEPKVETLGEAMRAAGYDTGYIGKWHLNGSNRSAAIPRERRFGFEYWKAAECTHDYLHSRYSTDTASTFQWEGYDAFAQTQDATAYIRAHAEAKRPFFLVLGWGPPHSPYETAPPKYRARYSPEKIAVRPNVPPRLQKIAQSMLANYYAHCTALDDCVGKLRATLRDAGLDGNTLLIFTSDHGDLLGSQGGRDKQQPYDESIRVPLLFHWPATFGPAPPVRDAVISSEDIMPTILGLCHVPIPDKVEGFDYSSYLRGGPNPSDGATLISCVVPFGQWSRREGGREYRGLRTPRYTYVRDLQGPWLLFDNETDPYQQTNLIGRPESAALQAELDAKLRRKLAATHDSFEPGDMYIRQWGYQVDKYSTVPYTE